MTFYKKTKYELSLYIDMNIDRYQCRHRWQVLSEKGKMRDLAENKFQVCMHACMHAKSPPSCPTLCDPYVLQTSVLGILQAKILEQVAIPFFRDLPDPGIELTSPVFIALQADSLLLSHWESPSFLGVQFSNSQF